MLASTYMAYSAKGVSESSLKGKRKVTTWIVAHETDIAEAV
jgi:hypothetical protein